MRQVNELQLSTRGSGMKVVISTDGSFSASFKLLAYYFSLKEIEYYCYSDNSAMSHDVLTKVGFYEEIKETYNSCISLTDFGDSIDYYKATNKEDTYFPIHRFPFKGRADAFLIEAIEKIGENSGFGGNTLKIVEIPDDVEWLIERDNEMGYEWVAEKHRTWS